MSSLIVIVFATTIESPESADEGWFVVQSNATLGVMAEDTYKYYWPM